MTTNKEDLKKLIFLKNKKELCNNKIFTIIIQE